MSPSSAQWLGVGGELAINPSFPMEEKPPSPHGGDGAEWRSSGSLVNRRFGRRDSREGLKGCW